MFKISSVKTSEKVNYYLLKNYRNKETEALEWLLENSDKAIMPVSPEDGSSTSGAVSSSIEDLTPSQAVARLLENFRDFRRRQFEPNQIALKQLVEMGFSEVEVVEALQITGNNQTAAVSISDACLLYNNLFVILSKCKF